MDTSLFQSFKGNEGSKWLGHSLVSNILLSDLNPGSPDNYDILITCYLDNLYYLDDLDSNVALNKLLTLFASSLHL